MLKNAEEIIPIIEKFIIFLVIMGRLYDNKENLKVEPPMITGSHPSVKIISALVAQEWNPSV